MNRYLNDGWCNAIYHDRFEELCKEIREITINPVKFIIDRKKKKLNFK